MRLRFAVRGFFQPPRRFPHRPGAKNSGTSLFFVSVPFTNSSKRVIILRDG